MIDQDLSRYKSFVQENYPNTGAVGNIVFDKIYIEVKKNMTFIKLIKKIDNQSDNTRTQLYQDFQLFNLRILYHLPSNDEFVNNIIVRVVSENILRLCLSLINKECADIHVMSYNNLISNLEERAFSRRYPTLYDHLTRLFGNYSQDVHGENIGRLSEKEYLTSIRNIQSINELQKILKVYENISKEIVPFFLKEIKTKREDLNVGVLSEIERVVGQEAYEKNFCRKEI
ncbi:hypothetical protein [Paenibacillus sp. WLX2291]|uniref:hypothetical protein n=1 Tax=Paenibacillus sp. WLX2291 TaxID=3296934 RepID=UPI00398435C6